MMMNKLTRPGSVLVAVLLVLLPAQPLLASVILNVQPGPGGKPIARSFIKDTVVGERLEAGPKEILEVLLSDGTSLTLAPGSALVVESFTYDPNSQSGQLSVRLEQGRFRVVGGLLNNTGNIAVQTPSGKLDLDNAAVFVEVRADGATRASLLHGKSLKMTTNGKSETVERPGFEVVSAGANQPLKSPSRQDPKMVTADVLALNSQALLDEEGGGDGLGDPGGQGSLVLASLNATGSETPFSSGPLTTVQPPPFTRPGLINVGLNPSDGFGPGEAIRPPDISENQPTQANGDNRSLAQVRDNATVDASGNNFTEATREKGRTTNRLFNSSSSFTQVLLGNQKPMPVGDNCDGFCSAFDNKVDPPDTNLAYVFSNESGLSLVIDRVGINLNGNHIFQGGTFDVTAPFQLSGIQLLQPNEVFVGNIETITESEFTGRENVGIGSIFKEATHFKILQAGFSHVGNGLVKRGTDNFLLVEVRPGQIVEGKPVLDPNRTERFLFATGDIDNRLNPTFETFPKQFSVDRFFISAGLENFEQKDITGKTVADNIRAFLRKETGLNLSRVDTGLLVVNPGPESSAVQSTLLHADVGLQGTGSGQQSSISVTLGKVEYQVKTCLTCDIQQSVEAVVDGRTVGSSRGAVDGATVGLSSPIRSTAAGGGNPALNREGYAGYFVLENFDPEPQDPGEASLMGGTEKPLGGSGNDQNYAYLRLATATGSSQPTLRNESTLNGWMGGLAEFENGSNIGLTQVDSGDTPDNIKIQTSPTNNTMKADFTLFGQNPNQATTYSLGEINVDGTSAFVDDNRFAARSSNSNYEVAMVSADLFRDGNSGNLPAALNRPDGTSIPQYEHLKWGFFFGDTKTNTGAREHVHLGTWIAGKIPTGDSLSLRGTASYSGHSIGNVFNNGSLYTAVGSFNNQWNFDKRTGTVNMSFDEKAYTGTTAIKASTFNFNGNLNAPGRTGGLQGSFVAPVNPTPAAVMGNFAIAETPGNATYRAAGTFGAERK